MSDADPPDPDDAGGGLPFLGDLGKLFASSGPMNVEIARQVAVGLAGGGGSEANVDPGARIDLEGLARVAELKVASTTGLSLGAGSAVEPVNRTTFAHRTLSDHEPLFTDLARSLSDAGAGAGAGDDDSTADPMAGLLGGLQQMMGPVLMGLNTGYMVGHVAQRAMGQYDLPLPRPDRPILVVPANLDGFAAEWSLPAEEVRLWVCVSEMAHHVVLRRSHVAERLTALLREGAQGLQVDPSAIEERLAGVDPTDPAGLQDALGDPEVLLGALTSPRRTEVRPRLDALLAVVAGYVDWVLDEVGPGLIGSYGPLTEALRRRRVEASAADRMIERLLGLELDRGTYERGEAFVAGVVERAGPDALARLWEREEMLPTPAEVDAAGLWLARIDL